MEIGALNEKQSAVILTEISPLFLKKVKGLIWNKNHKKMVILGLSRI